MRHIAILFLLTVLGACYQVEGETVPAALSVRVDGLNDGLYRRPDGVEVMIAWNAARQAYDVTAYDVTGKDAPGGTARATRLVPGVFLVQYRDAASLTLLASLQGKDVVLMAPLKATEQSLIKAHGLGLRPGPINALTGPGRALTDFFKDLAASGDYTEGGRLVFLR